MSDQYGVRDAACPLSTREGGGGLAQRLYPGVARTSQLYPGPRDGDTQRVGWGGAGGRTRLPLTWPPGRGVSD